MFKSALVYDRICPLKKRKHCSIMVISEETSRNKQHIVAMDALYDILTYQDMGEEIDVEDIVSGLCETPYEDAPIYVKSIILATLRHLNEEIALLEGNMIRWKFNRLNRVEQAILLLSLSHFFYVEPEIDKGIVINVAVNLAKNYLDAKDYRFVNAILDKVLVRE